MVLLMMMKVAAAAVVLPGGCDGSDSVPFQFRGLMVGVRNGRNGKHLKTNRQEWTSLVNLL